MNEIMPNMTFDQTSFSDEKLEQLGDISNLVRHELRTPLTSIHGVLKLLQSEYSDGVSADGGKLIDIAIVAANRLTRLADALEGGSDILRTMISSQEIENMRLENDLIKGLENREFSLHFQPFFSAQEQRIVGFEALARWQHPTRGLISPGTFIPIAEKSGIINPLGLSLLQAACQTLHEWQQQLTSQPPLTMSINLSSIQLSDPNLGDKIKSVLNFYAIQPHTLAMEVTESALIENSDIALETILKLKSMGIDIYLDDFGTGYSSLSRLQELPFDAIKIDRSFVMQQNWTISKAILLLADSLQVSVIAEGIETEEQFHSLRNLGCKMMQGYYFSKPIDAACALQLLIDQAPALLR